MKRYIITKMNESQISFLTEFKANNPIVPRKKFRKTLARYLKNEIYAEFRPRVPNLPNDNREILVIEMMFLSYQKNTNLYLNLTKNFPVAKEIFESFNKEHLDLLFNKTDDDDYKPFI